MSTYTVKKGDTLSKIAKLHKTSIQKLQKLNPSLITDVNKISVGWVLKVPSISTTPIRCEKCSAFEKALLDIQNLKSVKAFESLIGD